MTGDPYKYFRVEARELVDGLSQGILELEQGETHPDLIAKLLRLAHTLKGAARVVKQLNIADHSHHLEEVLGELREANRNITSDEVRRLLVSVDQIEKDVQALGLVPDHTTQSPLKIAPVVVDDAFQTVRVDVAEMDDLLRALTSTGVEHAELKRKIAEVRRLSDLASALSSRLQLRGRSNPQSIDTGELALCLDLEQGLVRIAQALEDGSERVEQELSDARQVADRLRLIPIQVLTASLTRAVRDAAEALKKEVSFEIQGGELRLDAQLIGPLRDAFLHVVRNAVAHGIESPSERARANKPARGFVRLSITPSGSEVVWRCSDDGRGIDVMAVRQVLMARGMLHPSESLSREALLKRLFSGGISTSTEVTQISGRGIGLDVLRETALRLKGQVSVESELGRGTSVVLRVPISVSSVRALLVEAAGTVFAIPLGAIVEAVRLTPLAIHSSSRGETIAFDNDVITYAPLSRLVRGDGSSRLSSASSAVIIHVAGHRVAIGVDVLLGTFDVVVRPLPQGVNADAIVSAVSLDAAGNPRLLLEPEELIKAASVPWSGPERTVPQRPPILVIDDSLTTRMLEQSILESAGYEVDLAVSAEQGLEKARARHYALFLVDVEMPGMDGFEFVTLTRADPELRKTPAILVTSRNEPDDFERGTKAGASDYIVKGEFDQNRLLATIERLLEQ